jgi:hypothetical protein
VRRSSEPPIEPPKDTAFVKHIRIESKLLTAFWARPMHLGAAVPFYDDSYAVNSENLGPYMQGAAAVSTAARCRAMRR